MPSPPLAPDDGPIDIEHLRRMTLGDASLEREVLAMFSAQAVGLVGTLAALPADAAALAHTLKGSARAIGAFRVADAAARLEALLQNGGDPAEALAELDDAVAQAALARSTRSCAGPDPEPVDCRRPANRAAGFRPDRWRGADRPVIGLPGPPSSGSTSKHGQDTLCRPYRRNPHHRRRERRDRDGSGDPQRDSRASKPNAAGPAPARPATSMSTKPGARRSARPRRWKRTCWISASTCGRIRGCRARSR